MAFNSLAENADRLSQRIQESLQERTRDFTRSAAATYLDAPDLDKPTELVRLLNSGLEREKLEGLKRIVALISKNRNVSTHFAQVIKNVASPNLEIRKLVYIYLLRYASSEPDLALLSINTFQKDLRDPNPLIRAMALRVLSGIPVSSIGSIVAMGIKNSATDSSPYVRKVAALAIPKLYQLDASHLYGLMQTLSVLLRDRSPLTIGCVAVAFNALCPDRLELLHQHYRRLCRMVVDADEWGQIHVVDLLGRYARTMLRKPNNPAKQLDEVSEADEDDKLDPDVALLLECSRPLLRSRNPAVVMAVARVYYYVGHVADRRQTIEPLLRLLRVSEEVCRVALEDLRIIATNSPELLQPYASRFYVRADEITQVKLAKLCILVALISVDNAQTLLREFKDYVVDTDDVLVADAIRAIGRCAQLVPDTAESSLNALTMLIRSPHDAAVGAAVVALKVLHQLRVDGNQPEPSKTPNVVSSLAFQYEQIQHPQARACILWMVGQYARRLDGAPPLSHPMPEGLDRVEPWAPDILRKAVKSFKEQTVTVKLQTLTLAAKLFVIAPTHEGIRLLARYALQLARYDLDYDLRDRGRFLTSLLRGVSGGIHGQDDEEQEDHGGVVLRQAQVEHVLFEGRSAPKEDVLRSTQFELIGSATLITHQALEGLRKLPEWTDDGTDSSLRDTEDDVPAAPVYAAPASRIVGMSGSAFAARLGAPSNPSSPVVLTPGGGSSPAGSAPKPRPQFIDLEDFFKSDEDDSGDEEEGSEEEAEAETRAETSGRLPPSEPNHNKPASTIPSARGTPKPPDEPIGGSWGHGYPEDYPSEDSSDEDEDAFLRRG